MKCNETVAEIQQNFSTKNGFLASRLESFHQDIEDNFAQSIAAKMVPRTLSPVQTYKSDSNGNSINAIATTNGNSVDAIDTNGDAVDDNGSTVSGGEEKENFKDGEVTVLSSQVCKLQETLSSLQQESEQQINNLRQELADKTSIVESLQHQIRMKMILNLAGAKPNQVFQAFQDMQGNQDSSNEDAVTSWRKNLELLAGSQDKFKSPPQPGSPASSPAPMDAPEQAPSTPEGDRFSPQRNIESMSPGKERLHLTPSPLQINPQHQGGFSLGGGLLPPHSVATSSPLTHQPLIVPKSFANTGANLWRSRIPKEDPLEERLHEMLRYNMEKFADAPIDTIGDSRRVRELLSVHNIGQRLFAKYVLGLSQGTVSELLSKPKSWDKLTEKGRDSYRKMNAWCYDENAIGLLKSLIPRKGELVRPPLPEMSRGGLHHPSLGDLVRPPHSGVAGGGSLDVTRGMSRSPLMIRSPSSLQEKPSPSDEGNGFSDNISSDSSKQVEDPLAKMYIKDEFTRLLAGKNFGEAAVAAAAAGFKTGFPQLNPFSSAPVVSAEDLQKSQADIQQALTLYQEELARLQGGTGIKPLDDSITDDSSKDEEKLDVQKSFFPTKEDGSAVSPLQRMASITNALVSQPPPVSFNSHSQRPLRNNLPPITQQQFDRYSHVNTDDTVRRIKEILSQYSISQRLFGEAVLGLSQGSVSDLLARPKPWHMLTQKGREPFIRMRIFLEDEGAIHRLVASQYKVAPDKIIRSGPFPNPMAFPSPRPGVKIPDGSPLPGGVGVAGLLRGVGGPNPFDSPLLPSTLRFGADPNLSGFDPLAAHRKMGPRLPQGPGGLGPLAGPTPNLFEMAALTTELDTHTLTTRVKEILLANNIGQKVFGETVLGLSQGSVSELLSKPKPWHMLSIKGREPFIRMQLWLNDPMNLERLKSGCGSLTPTHIAAEQLRRDIAAGSAGKRRFGLDSSSDRSSPLEKIDDDSGSNHGGGSDSPLAKRMRQGHVSGSSGVDDQQREALMLAFALDPVPQTATVEFLSTELGVDQSAVSSWYSSHKLRLKQLHGIKPEALFPNNNNTDESQQGIDPTKFRILMAHRRMEMQAGLAAATGSPFPFPLNPAMFGLPPSSLPTSRSDTSASGGGVGGGSSDSGLDLRFKNEVDLTNQDGGNGRVGGGEDVSDGDSDKNMEEDDDDAAQGSSRRKGTAPQWMKPDWTGTGSEGNEQDAKSSEEPINGVCVRNIPDYESERGGLGLGGGLPVVSSAEPVVSS